MKQQNLVFALLIVTGFFGLAGLWFWGFSLPAEQNASATLATSSPCPALFARLTYIPGIPAWSPFVAHIEALPLRNGRPVAREQLRDGTSRLAILLERQEPGRLVWLYESESGGPQVLLRYDFVPNGNGCQVKAAETRVAAAPMQRVLSKLRSPGASLHQQLTALAAAVGESADISVP